VRDALHVCPVVTRQSPTATHALLLLLLLLLLL
jgi:hypothetical protein